MIVKRIVTNIHASDPEKAETFYRDLLGLDLLMDQGWIRTYGSHATAAPQCSFAVDGGSGTELPHLSIEVDDLDEAIRRFRNAGITIEYGPTTEPWGVRRIYVRDPFGYLINVMQHD